MYAICETMWLREPVDRRCVESVEVGQWKSRGSVQRVLLIKIMRSMELGDSIQIDFPAEELFIGRVSV